MTYKVNRQNMDFRLKATISTMPNTGKEVSASEMERRRNVAQVIRDHIATTDPPITVDDLAKKAGTQSQTLYNLLNCRRGIGPRLAKKLARAGVDRNDLYRAADFAINDDNQSVKGLLLGNKFLQLPLDEQETVEGIIDGFLRKNRRKK